MRIKIVSLCLNVSRFLIPSTPQLFSVVLIKQMLLTNSYIHKESITIMNKTPLYKNLNKWMKLFTEFFKKLIFFSNDGFPYREFPFFTPKIFCQKKSKAKTFQCCQVFATRLLTLHQKKRWNWSKTIDSNKWKSFPPLSYFTL